MKRNQSSGGCAALVASTAACIAAFGIAITAPARADDTGVAPMHDLAKQDGHLCMVSHQHSGSGDGATKPAAMASALKDWFAYTAGEYGSDWASWAKSAGKKVSYTKAATGWTATVVSRPCK